MPEYLNSLNPEQKKAAEHNTGPALVLAGPGSGKTRVLTHRIANLIDTENALPSQIMAITFTNKAASEMKNRVKLLTKQNCPNWIGTFHSLCARILRIDGKYIGIESNFNIYDTDDSTTLIKNIIEEQKISTTKIKPSAVLSTISGAKNELIRPKEYVNFARGYFQENVAKIYPIYQKKLESANSLDFADLIYKTIELFDSEPGVLEKYNRNFKYVLVDEYQDTNRAQYTLASYLAKSHNNLFVVGDMAQSIYSWRGADYRNIINFKKDYPNTKVYNLAQNYRSTKVIVEAAKELIKKNRNNINLELWTENIDGEKITLYEAGTEKEEAKYVCDKIKESGLSYDSIVVLYRTNAQSRNIEDEFVKRGVPYRLIGGIKFYGRKEIKDVISFLKVIYNPKDTIAWQRIINIPPRGIGPKTFSQIEDSGFNLDLIYEKTKIDYKKLINKKDKLTTLEILEKILKKTSYIRYLQSQNEEDEKILERIENIKELKSVAQELPTLDEFLENVALVEADSESEGFGNDNQKVTLMTLHAAKGLEYKLVFIVGMEEGLFPHSRSLEDAEQLEEERRLCYVGITRAEQKLHMTYARRRLFFGRTNANMISRFISEIPEHLIEQSLSGNNPAYKMEKENVDDFFESIGW
ncbi:ATP-dependent DNA helicase PcrA [candidate division WWE3 bacterium CG10_big_fil_rev_8_21_14_0_10_32_10]|uniref:DNA 3'-5' helicase n=1 Tax=candidate division WWE3 bacterium CG10_big_fil_rev_8_21_14_0_10_32_10 TaxID=1975090 RepID=A0A2H0R9J9_UNCKA|nr:MAG: ATP-dependent DNA helicase PcrA [candidate division WWE3 bacterium CG10_big_fil_rev_8_21_14_0_10_32_10]